MKRLLLILMVMFAFAVNADAQGFLKRLKDRAINSVENQSGQQGKQRDKQGDG